MTDSEWDDIFELVYVSDGAIVVDSRLSRRFPALNEDLLCDIIESNIVETDDLDDNGDPMEDIDWGNVIIEYNEETA